MLNRLRSSVPLLVLGAGAGTVFLANVVARRTFSPEEFVRWAYLTSLVALFFSFSLLGSEQLVIRCARDAGADGLRLPRRAAGFIAASFAAFALVYLLVLDGRLFAYRLGAWALPVLLAVGAIQVAYQLERARGELLSSQLAWNGWKLALLPLALLAPAVARRLAPGRVAELAVTGALVLGLVAVGAVLFRARRALSLGGDGSEVGKVFLPFLASLGTMAALGSADRVVLEKVHLPEQFAGYVYLVVMLATPFGILASWFGFKEAVRYRRGFSRAMLRADVGRTTASAAALVLGWSALCYLTRGLSGLAFDPALWALLGVLSVLRCGYAVLSAAMGVRGSPAAMYAGNAATGAALALFAWAAIGGRASVVGIVLGYVLVWAVRFAVFLWLLGLGVEEGAREAPEARLA